MTSIDTMSDNLFNREQSPINEKTYSSASLNALICGYESSDSDVSMTTGSNETSDVETESNKKLRLSIEEETPVEPSEQSEMKYIQDKQSDLYELTVETITEYVDSIILERNLTQLSAKRVALNVYPKLKTVNTIEEYEEMVIGCSAELYMEHYDYTKIAMYVIISNLHSLTHDDYLQTVQQLRANVDKNGDPAPIVTKSFADFVDTNIGVINQMLVYDRDYEMNFFGFRTFEGGYMKKMLNGTPIERPQHVILRVAISLHYRSPIALDKRLELIYETYNYMSLGFFTHATPTLFNAGTPLEQLSSCFLMGIADDMAGIGDSWKEAALISKNSGGIAIHVSNIRAKGAYIRSTQGTSSGLRMLTVFNQIARYADQGGKRKGGIAIYLAVWHADIFFFLDLKKNNGAETERARDIFPALMINDIFMKRVKNEEMWSLMCPDSCPKLLDKYGEEFEKEYLEYEKMGRFVKQIEARELFFKIMEAQIETGTPYISYMDAINRKSNYKHYGTINSSNLCNEINLFSSPDETAVCNLASIALPKFVVYDSNGNPSFDYEHIVKVARIITRNLNNVIDINFYPTPQTKKSNMLHRPLGVGVQGLADVFIAFKTPFDSELARDLNRKIFESIDYGTTSESMLISKERYLAGMAETYYPTFPGSPMSKGLFQHNLWNLPKEKLSGMYDWDQLRADVMKYGVRNAVTTACMPTASTSQILGNNECIEPYTSNIYTRSTLAGSFYVVNKQLMNDLTKLGMWNKNIIDLIKYYDGSIEEIKGIPDDIKAIYRTVWNIPQKSIIEMSADRAPFISQTQSLNLHVAKPTFDKLIACHFDGWEAGLKTGMYYLRTKPASDATKFGLDLQSIIEIEKQNGIKEIETPVSANQMDTEIVNQVKPKKVYTCEVTLNPETGEEEHLCCGS